MTTSRRDIKYPVLRQMLKWIGSDNNMSLIKPFHWEPVHAEIIRSEVKAYGYFLSLPELEWEAETISPELRKVLCVEEDSIQEAIVKVYNLERLHLFLNEAFDGRLTNTIYRL